MAVNEQLSPADAVRVLNEMLAADPEATRRLVVHRVPCSEEMADHPTVQVGRVEDHSGADVRPGDESKEWCVGLIGILNGLFGSYDDEPLKGYGPISIVYDNKDADLDGESIARFDLTRKPKEDKEDD